ncbi:MAG: hypothetical protein IPO86_14930 [Saprospiraceae bacterium]|nr:hypothetical protein [Saprospiraceae bacterium]
MKAIVLVLLNTICSLISINLVGQEIIWTEDKKIITGGSGSNIRPRILALDQDHGILVWGNEHSQSIHYSFWEKDSLSSILNINMKQTKAFVTNWASTEIAGRDQYVYIVYKEDPAETGKIYLLKSIDFGKTFSLPIPVVHPIGFFSRFPGIAIDKDYQPIVSYMRFKTDWSSPEYVSIRSSDFGNSFDPYTEVTDKSKGEACDCCPVSMETDGNRIAVFYRNNRNNIRNMTAAISQNNGLSFDITQELDTADWFLQSCPSTGGDGFFNGQNLHTCWSSGRTGVSKVFYSRLNIDTKKIDAFQIMNHTQGRNFQQNYPRISGNQDTVGICWNELFTSMDIYFTYFTGQNSGDLIKNTIRINKDINGSQSSPDVGFNQGNFYLCWQDLNDNTIHFKKGSFKKTTAQDEISTDPSLKILNTNKGILVQSNFETKNWSLINLQGIEIAAGKKFPTSFIPIENAGIYILSYERNQQLFSSKFIFD